MLPLVACGGGDARRAAPVAPENPFITQERRDREECRQIVTVLLDERQLEACFIIHGSPP